MSAFPSRDPAALLSAFESAVHAHLHAEAFAAVNALVDEFGSHAFARDLSPAGYRGHRYIPHAAFCERFTAAWCTLLLDDALDIIRMPTGILLSNLATVHVLVQGTAEGTCDAAIRILTGRTGGRHSASSAARLVLLWVPGSRLGIDLFALHAGMPQLVTAQAVATVAALVACTPEAHAAREAAIAFLASGRARVEDYALFGISNDLGTAWMRCSYAPSPAAHDVKIFLNAVISRHEGTRSLPLPSPSPAADGRPVMLVPLDSFSSGHAIYRYYAPVIAACRPHFHLVALVRARTLDEISARLFDRVIDAGEAAAPHDDVTYAALARRALDCRPALVFYPSVGMSRTSYVLAQYRLAPVQVMALGHLATSHLPQLDALVTEEQWVVDPARYSERVVTVPRGTLRFALPAGHAPRTRRTRSDDVVRVAVPSVCQKWTFPFLQALQRVDERLGRRVEFHFFSGEPGIGYPAAMNAVLRLLPRAVVHPSLPYADYCDRLAGCDLHAGTFPFGGGNSVIDSLLHGLPVLCMAPEDARGAQDVDFIGRAGLPGWLVAHDVDDYVAKMIRILEEPGTLAALRAALADRSRLESVFLAGGHPEAFVDALRALAAPG